MRDHQQKHACLYKDGSVKLVHHCTDDHFNYVRRSHNSLRRSTVIFGKVRGKQRAEEVFFWAEDAVAAAKAIIKLYEPESAVSAVIRLEESCG